MKGADLERPEGLSKDGNRAYDIIMTFLESRGMTDPGGCKTFYSPAEWKSRGEEYGRNSELVIVHDGGDVAAICNMDYGNYKLHDALQEALSTAGFYFEGCTCWYSAVYGS